MLIAVTGDLVAPLGDRPEELGMRTRGHAQDEEGRACPEVVQEPEQPLGLARERRAGPLPVGGAETPSHELVPVLKIDAEKQRVRLGPPPSRLAGAGSDGPR